MSIFSKIFGDANEKYLKTLWPIVYNIRQYDQVMEKMDDKELKAQTQEFINRLEKGETPDQLLPEVFAQCREAIKRVIKHTPHDEQLLAAICLHKGQVAEMKTGEGKTDAIAMAAFLNSLKYRNVHVVTANDYLAKRDSCWLGQMYSFLGKTPACLQNMATFRLKVDEVEADREKGISEMINFDKLEPIERKEAYKADIIHGTSSEFGFDYLRDNMATSKDKRVQNDLDYAIIDECDSILIDEARTPLIISAPAQETTERYYKFAKLVETLNENEDYNIDEKMKSATLTEKGIHKLEKALGVENIYVQEGITTVHHIEQALRAKTLFKKDRDYVVKDNEIVIVDEFTGRLMQGRRYSEGLHQAIEAKENVEVKSESQTLATVSVQNYFRLYTKLSGCTGTAATEAEEFSKIYKLDVTIVPTHKPVIRNDLPDRIYASEDAKYKAIVKEIKKLHNLGRPILVGTISIEKNELLDELLNRAGIPHNILNAKNHEREAEIIAQAGRVGAVTIATNMAGRGVDIVLGGSPQTPEEYKKVLKLGGLHVLGTERHESRRIDNQLRGRSGRQGDPGSSQFYVSLEDDLMRVFGKMDKMKAMMTRLGANEDIPIENKIVSRSIEAAQKKVESHNFDIRKHLVEYDNVINKHREIFYKKRKEIVVTADNEPEKLRDIILKLINEEINYVVDFHTSDQDINKWNLNEIYEVANTIFPADINLKNEIENTISERSEKETPKELRDKIKQLLIDTAQREYILLEERIKEAASSQESEDVMPDIEKFVLLRSYDSLWVEHLEAMDHLKTGIRLRGYAQKDPLVEYKKEGYRLFNQLMLLVRQQIVYSIYKTGYAKRTEMKSLLDRKGVRLSNPGGRATANVIKVKKKIDGKKVGRNDPCPCGSNKKYKKCCGK